jgi:hypothetical protein
MAILKGFPTSTQSSSTFDRIRTREFRIDYLKDLVVHVSPCPKLLGNLRKQNERVRSALVVYALNVMEDLDVDSNPQIMQDCLDVGEEMYALYMFEKHGPYGDYIQGHFKRLLLEKDYYAKVVSRSFFG